MKTLDFSGKQFYQHQAGFATAMQVQAQKPAAYKMTIQQWKKQ